MKKLLSIFGVLVFMFSLIACGGGEATEEAATEDEAQEETPATDAS